MNKNTQVGYENSNLILLCILFYSTFVYEFLMESHSLVKCLILYYIQHKHFLTYFM